MAKNDLTSAQADYAVFLPAISGFYATFIGKQRDPVNGPYVDSSRFPLGMLDMEELNWLNDAKGLFPYRWSLYSGGHANLDLGKQDWSEDMVRNRDPNTLILGDSGGFQIAKGLWEGEWRDPTSPEVQQKLKDLVGKKELRKNNKGRETEIDLHKEYENRIKAAQKKRETVLKWLDGIADYGMILDIPTWVVHDEKASRACGITTHEEAVDATKYNNEYFMTNRQGVKNGGARFLNVLQGANHAEADDWYETMKHYCDPAQYPDTHFNGWAMGGQNMCDVHLVLRRLVALRYDGLLQEGCHDWMHFLGTSKLEWAVLLTVLQRAVRKYVNPAFTISFDCASPFLATANGQVYFENVFEHDSKWSYRMAPSADDKRYATDTRPWKQGVVADGIYPIWQDSPISDLLRMKDICVYKAGVPKSNLAEPFDPQNPDHYDVLPDTNKVGKWGKTSWDSFSYALLMGHNVYQHIAAVQEANRRFDSGEYPAMMRYSGPGHDRFQDIVEEIFAAPDRATAESIIEQYDKYWMEIVGTRGFSGKKAKNSMTMFNALFDAVEESNEDPELDTTKLDKLEENPNV